MKQIITAFLFIILANSAFSQDYLSTEKENPQRVFKISNTNDSISLRTVSKEVTRKDVDTKQIISQLYATVTDSATLGVGIAAPQIGINKRIILVQRFDKVDNPFEAYLNPYIVQTTKFTEKMVEGCLSVDSIRAEVVRPYAIMINYTTPSGCSHTELVEGYTARIFQHEIDHLNGILFTDKASSLY